MPWETRSTGSKVMFWGDFKEELQKTIDALEEFMEKNLHEYFEVDSILGWRNNLKIRVNDRERNIEKMVNCIFRYHHNEEKFGFVNIEIVVSELSQKPRLHFVGRFGVLEREKIHKSILEDIIICIKKI
jgi:hypothetical protein